MSNGYKNLIVWQKSMDLVDEVYKLTRLLPKEETFALSNQMRRACVSIPSNIAEGYERSTQKEYANFLTIARASRAELETQILICIRQGYFKKEDAQKALDLCNEIKKILTTILLKISH